MVDQRRLTGGRTPAEQYFFALDALASADDVLARAGDLSQKELAILRGHRTTAKKRLAKARTALAAAGLDPEDAEEIVRSSRSTSRPDQQTPVESSAHTLKTGDDVARDRDRRRVQAVSQLESVEVTSRTRRRSSKASPDSPGATGTDPAKSSTANKALCYACQHPARDHVGRGGCCLVCFACKTFTAARERPTNPQCRCLHPLRRHQGKNRCATPGCRCTNFRPLKEPDAPRSPSVRTVSGGMSESSRRRH